MALASAAVADELPTLAVKLSTGKTLRATLDSETDLRHLWLRFGSTTTVVRRGIDWQFMESAWEGSRQRTQAELIQIAADARRLNPVAPRPNKVVIPSSNLVPSAPPRQAERPARIASVTFDAQLGNWDADVEMDGLWVQVLPLDNRLEPVAARGVLTVELYSLQRVDQDSVEQGRGSQVRRVGEWSVPVTCEPGGGGHWVQLPFSPVHPEFDVTWSPFGLVHVQFTAAGHGVFHHSIDGLRIRPWAPLRDVLEAKTGTRFLPTEIH
jgi:hypothetical protein